jgi:putative glutamine amidotransferase
MKTFSTPLIGISCHLAEQSGPLGNNRPFHRLAARYTGAVRDAGGIPVILPAHPEYAAEPSEAISRLDGLLLSGGTCLPPGAFSRNKSPELRETDPRRYDYEADLVREAWRKGVPLMGICRGHQTLVEVLGGELILNIAVQNSAALNHYQELSPESTSHRIAVVAGTILAGCLGFEEKVNSFHRQAVHAPPEGMKAAAVSEDGLIEAVEGKDPFVLGVQFHPEWLYRKQKCFLRIFEEFVSRAGRYALDTDPGADC